MRTLTIRIFLMENSYLSSEQIGKFQDAFIQHDCTGQGSINTSQLRQVLRYCGQNPTEAELQVTSYHIIYTLQISRQASKP